MKKKRLEYSAGREMRKRRSIMPKLNSVSFRGVPREYAYTFYDKTPFPGIASALFVDVRK